MIQSDKYPKDILGKMTPALKVGKHIEEIAKSIVEEGEIAKLVDLMKQQIKNWKDKSAVDQNGGIKGKGAGKHSSCKNCKKECKTMTNGAAFQNFQNISNLAM